MATKTKYEIAFPEVDMSILDLGLSIEEIKPKLYEYFLDINENDYDVKEMHLYGENKPMQLVYLKKYPSCSMTIRTFLRQVKFRGALDENIFLKCITDSEYSKWMNKPHINI